MISFETDVRIERAVEDVFAYVSEPRTFPRWNSAVDDVRSTGGGPGAGATYRMERTLPGGRAVNDLEVVASEPPAEFVLRTTSGPTPFRYRYRFESDGAGTVVRLHGDAELGGAAELLGPLAGRALRRGVDANLADLKAILEREA